MPRSSTATFGPEPPAGMLGACGGRKLGRAADSSAGASRSGSASAGAIAAGISPSVRMCTARARVSMPVRQGTPARASASRNDSSAR